MAQLVEQLTLNQRVAGSSPAGRTEAIRIKFYHLGVFFSHSDKIQKIYFNNIND
jgi:hypothetical protein